MNWILHRAAQNWVQYRLDADSVLGVGGRGAGKELWEILEQMKEVSSVWAKNHAVRLVTTTALASAMLARVEYGIRGDCGSYDCPSHSIVIFYLIIAASLYLFVWVTAAAPGYITDALFSSIHRKLYKMWPEAADGKIPVPSVLPVLAPCQQQPHPLTPLEAKATVLMHRVHYLQDREGMHFAFVPMSLARAITVGTVLGYAIVFATRASK
jgi:hypothetical protein